MRGKQKRAEEGQQPQRSRSPYGYHVVTHADILRGLYLADQLGRYFLDDEKAGIARRLFAGYFGGTHSLPRLCKELNAEGVPAPSGGLWHEPTVRCILTNPVYKGEPVSGRQKCSTDESRLHQVHALTGRPITRPEVRRLVPEDERLTLSAPPLVSVEVWNAVQARLALMKARHGGNPKRIRMLSGLCFCPYCGAGTRTKYQKANGKTYCYYWCGSRSKSRNFPGERACRPDLYPIAVVEQAAVKAVREAWERPDAVAAALAVYQRGEPAASDADPRRELEAVDRALTQVKAEETAAVQAQIAGIMRGLSPDAYAEAFEGITARRREIESRRQALTASLARSRTSQVSEQGADDKQGAERLLLSHALEDAVTALTDDAVTGAEKRRLLGTVVEKVIPHKEGADVVFAPGILAPGILRQLGGEDDAAWEGARDTFHTTCMVCKVRDCVKSRAFCV